MSKHGRIQSAQEVLDDAIGTDVSGMTKKRVNHIMTSHLGLKFKKARVLNERANLLSSRV